MYAHAYTTTQDSAPQIAADAIEGEPANLPTSLDFRTLDVTTSMQVGICGNLMPDARGNIDINLTNYATNSVWMRLAAYYDNKLVGQTDAIVPGTYLPQMQINTTDIPDTKTQLTLKLLTYEPNTYYSEGAITINVVLNPSQS
jgi:hypothetical protein